MRRSVPGSGVATPAPSAPSTQPSAPSSRVSSRLGAASAAAPSSHTPASLSASMVRARFVTAIKGTLSAAPLATLATTGCEPDRAVLRHDHAVDAHRVRRPQAGPEVVWIGDPVQQQQKGRFGQPLEQLLARRRAAPPRPRARQHPDDARLRRGLPGAFRPPAEPARHAARRARPGRAGAGRVAGVHVDLAHAVRPMPKPCGDRVKADEQALLSAGPRAKGRTNGLQRAWLSRPGCHPRSRFMLSQHEVEPGSLEIGAHQPHLHPVAEPEAAARALAQQLVARRRSKW